MIDKTKIPGHWGIEILKNVCQVVTGATPSKNEIDNYGEEIPFVKPPQVLNNSIFDAPERLSTKGARNARLLPINSVLVTCIGNLGRTAINKVVVAFNQQINALIPSNNLFGLFLFYQAQSSKFNEQLNSLVSATTVPIVNKSKFESIQIVVPPISEQHQIVSKIEELFSELDKGKQQLETVKRQLKEYRKSLLNTIIKDKQNHLISSIIEKLDQGWSPRCHNEKSVDDGEWAVIKTTAVQSGKFVSEENKILPLELNPRVQHELHPGDILITRAGPRIRVGVCCMVRKVRPKLINCDKVYRIKIKNEIVMPEYIEMVLNTPYYQHEIEKMKTGINDSGVNLTQAQFLKISIPIPDINDQMQIVSEIESRLSVCDKMEEIIETSLKQAESLRQSILKQAFEGKFAF